MLQLLVSRTHFFLRRIWSMYIYILVDIFRYHYRWMAITNSKIEIYKNPERCGIVWTEKDKVTRKYVIQIFYNWMHPKDKRWWNKNRNTIELKEAIQRLATPSLDLKKKKTFVNPNFKFIIYSLINEAANKIDPVGVSAPSNTTNLYSRRMMWLMNIESNENKIARDASAYTVSAPPSTICYKWWLFCMSPRGEHFFFSF